jgi:hypothetical protein
MKRNVVFSILGAALALSPLPAAAVAPAAAPAAAGLPFGSFGGHPNGNNAADSTLPLTGWALAADGVFAVDIVVDGGIVGRANYGRTRPGVARRFPGYPDSNAAGFAYQLDTTHFLNGLHTVSARVQSRTGQVSYLNSLTFQFSNVTANLIPFGAIDYPDPQAEFFGNCARGGFFTVVDGWAVDPGVQRRGIPSGVAYVELLIDHSFAIDPLSPSASDFYNTHNDCHYSAAQGGLSSCYGLRRPDIEQQFPGLKDSPHSGFRFVLDVGLLLAETDAFNTPLYTPGQHLLTIRAGDVFNQVTELAEVPVTFTCIDFTQNDTSLGQISTPVPGILYSGTVLANGWALDLDGVQQVNIQVDGIFVGTATYGFPLSDISSRFPSYPNSPNPGWVFALDTTQLSNGEHRLSALVVDSTGRSDYIGNLKFIVANVIP